jgi:rRNA maturation RNase YbeY
MDQPGATDVLTFDLRDEPASREVEGEIVVSVDTARRQADELGTAFREELVRYVIHGVLHLTGKDDRTTDQRKTMRFAENRILARCIEDETLGPTLASPRQRAKGALR